MPVHAEVDPFNKTDLERLSEVAADPALSILMPTWRAGRNVRQNPIRYKNMLKEAEEQLAAGGWEEERRQELLAEPRRIQADDDWWQHQSDGLAVFVTDEMCQMYRLPLPLEEQFAVGRRFYVRPLVRLVQTDGRFYLLAVSQNDVRLLSGTQHSVSELDVEKLPTDLRSALNIDEFMETLQQHSVGRADRAGGMMFHGQGGSGLEVEKKDEIRQFFHRIDEPLSAFLGDERVPLVFAGVEYLFPLFRETCGYAELAETPVTGNPDDLSAEELHAEGWSIVARHFDTQRQSALEKFHNASSTDKAVTSLDAIVRLAPHAGVDTLLLAEGEQRWARLDDQFKPGTISESYEDGAEELLNFAAVHALAGGGNVYSLPSQQMPQGQPAAALLRFRLS